MERMVHNRLYNLAETRGWLCSEQAGFRKLRSCEDQILRITQTISDGFQAAKPQRSLMALLDFSKAFDRVWREELLLAASSKGLPIPFARWLRDFLSNRTARVQINGERGDSAPLRQGLPQGGVLSPLLFLLNIDDLRSVVPETVKVALFADDVPLISSHYNKLVAEKGLQRAVTAVADWSASKKMVLNTDKCEVTFFCDTDSHEANWQPTISANNTRCRNSSESH